MNFLFQDDEDSDGYRGALLIEQTNTTWASLVQDLCVVAGNSEDDSTSNSELDRIFSFPWQQFYNNMNRSENFKDGAEVLISYVWSNTKLNLNTQDDQARLDQLQQAIARHVNAGKLSLFHLKNL